jgi:hypothetical protein
MEPLTPDDDLPSGDDAQDIPRDPPRKRRPDIAAAVSKLAAALRRQAAAASGDRVPDSMITDAAVLAAMDLAAQAEQLGAAEQQGWGDPTGLACRPPAGFAAALHALAAACRHAAVDVDSSQVLDVFSATIRLDHLAESLQEQALGQEQGTGGQGGHEIG